MLKAIASTFVPLTLLISVSAFAESFAKVDADIAEYDAALGKMNEEFGMLAVDASSNVWVTKKLQYMVDTDQYMRKFSMSVPHDHQYTKEEHEYFHSQFLPRWLKLDQQNTSDLKDLLKLYSWFTISQWGKACDSNAWLLVQHADTDPEFQKEVLAKLEKLYPSGETKPAHYAYLFDRIASSFGDGSKRQLQRYGTQGSCVGTGKWEPFPIEDPDNVDARRAIVGLGPLSDYIVGFKDICK